MPTFWRAFIVTRYWTLSKLFLHLLRWWFLFFSVLMWCITLTYLQILKNPCIPGISPSWSWYMSLLMYCWIQFASILLRIFASVLILAYTVLFLWYLCLVWVSGWGWPHRMSFGVFLPLQLFGKSFRRIGVNSSLNVSTSHLWILSLLYYIALYSVIKSHSSSHITL